MLYYHKCDDCLTPFSTIERVVDFCDCNGTVTFMGEVKGDEYVKTENRPACDGRCTHACGPVCDCQCGGANHGTGRTVKTVTVLGKVKAVGLSEEDVERAHAFRKLRDIAEEAFTKKYDPDGHFKNRTAWMAREVYVPIARARTELDKILATRVYNKRHSAILNFIVKNKI